MPGKRSPICRLAVFKGNLSRKLAQQIYLVGHRRVYESVVLVGSLLFSVVCFVITNNIKFLSYRTSKSKGVTPGAANNYNTLYFCKMLTFRLKMYTENVYFSKAFPPTPTTENLLMCFPFLPKKFSACLYITVVKVRTVGYCNLT